MTDLLYLVRHGQSTWNAARRTQGQLAGPPLTPRGRQQAEQAAMLIANDIARAGREFHRVVSSDLVRAFQTATILGRRLKLPVTLDQDLREQSLGSLEGLTYDESLALGAAHDWTDPDAAPGNGESPRAVFTRMARALARTSGRNVVIVSHGDALRYALGGLAGYAVGDCSWIEIQSGAVYAADADGVRKVEKLTPAQDPQA